MSTAQVAPPVRAAATGPAEPRDAELRLEVDRLRRLVQTLDQRLRLREDHRRAMLHILQDQHQSNLRLEHARKALIHIMVDLRKTTGKTPRAQPGSREQ